MRAPDLRSDERKEIDAAIAKARTDERERCAKIIEGLSAYTFCCPDAWSGGSNQKAIAEKIRAVR